MGNPTISYPGDDPKPCWACEHFEGLHTAPPVTWVWVTCASRGRFTQANPDVGCRRWKPQEATDPFGPRA